MSVDLLIRFVVLGGVIAVLFTALMILLLRRKSKTDAANYKAITGTSDVHTVYSIEKYNQRRKNMKSAQRKYGG